MSSCVSLYSHLNAVNLPLDIFTIRENSFSNHTALHNTYFNTIGNFPEKYHKTVDPTIQKGKGINLI